MSDYQEDKLPDKSPISIDILKKGSIPKLSFGVNNEDYGLQLKRLVSSKISMTYLH